MRSNTRLVALLPLAASLVLSIGCSRGDDPAYAKSANGSGPRATVIEVPSQPYQAVSVSGGATLAGVVSYTGAPLADSIATPARDQAVCGETVTVRTLRLQDDNLAEVVVWLTDARTGRPLPVSRRFELVLRGCAFEPHVQAVVTGGTLNVRNEDDVIYRSHAADTRTGETVTELPFTGPGQVIPLDRQLAAPALLEVKSTSHPWMRAWVAAFDHPYFAVTDEGGRFTIAGVPPGSYTLKAWHPALGVTTHPVTIGAEGASVSIKFGERRPAVDPTTGAQ